MTDMTFNDASAVLTSIFQQATGQTAQTPTNTGEFVSVATTALKTGYDPIMGAISQILGRTIFSIRPYYAKFRSLYADENRWGNHVRKINYGSTGGVETDPAFFDFKDGNSIDMYKINTPDVVQTNFYGVTPVSKHITRFRRQLHVAFRGPDEFNQFWAGVNNEIMNDLTQIHESTARMTIGNLIAGVASSMPDNVIHLLTAYNDLTGLSLTAQSLYQPENFSDFMRWMFAYINSISDFMTDRTESYHQQLPGVTLLRHTPKDRQIMYLYSPIYRMIETSTLAMTFHDTRLRFNDFEPVNYWQSPDARDSINVTPEYMQDDGTVTSPASAVKLENILGVIFDVDAAGYTTVDRESGVTPYNIAGSYWNIYYKFNDRYWNDFSENAVILCLD